jgi:hypothetical protein
MALKPLSSMEPVHNRVRESAPEQAIQHTKASNGNEYLVFGVSVWFIH